MLGIYIKNERINKFFMNEFLEELDYENLQKIIENDTAVGKKNNTNKVFFYSMFLCAINKYRKPLDKSVYVINGLAERKFENRQKASPIYYALFSTKIKEYYTKLSHVSYIKYGRRLQIFAKVLFHDCKGVPKGYIVDYLLWKEFFRLYPAIEIGGSGHYDRLTTQIALLSEMEGKHYYMKQHGLLGHAMHIPNKIPAYKVIGFDDIEIDKFRKEIICNKDCIYEKQYISTVEFVYTNFEKGHIGIIDTPIAEMNEIINQIFKMKNDIEYIVMLHPISNLSIEKLGDYSVEYTSGNKKEFNLEFIVSGPSTLVYDYLKAGYKKTIIVYAPDKNSGLYDIAMQFGNVFMCDTIEKIVEKIKEMIC